MPELSPAPGTTSIKLEGRDALGVLHRISTQALEDLEPGQVRSTLFCDFRARLLHRAAVAALADGSVWLVRDDAPAGELIEHLGRHVFREDVRIVNSSAGLVVRPVTAGFEKAPGAIAEAGGIPTRLRLEPEFGLAIEPGVWRAPSEEEESARILAGRPRHGHEIHPDFNPFEVGLASDVHLSKGCFTGQEVLMRLVTYESVRRRLVRVEGTGATPEAGRDMRRGGKVVGRLTSVAAVKDGWIALAVLRNEALEGELEIEGAAAVENVHAFPESHPLGLP